MTNTSNAQRTTTMHAILRSNYGSADVLRYREIEEPTLTADEVMIRVRAASVGAWDWHDMAGEPLVMRLHTGLRRPKIEVLGRDMAGEVAAVGSAVTKFRPGDVVYGECRATFAEYTVASQSGIARAPTGLSFAELAAVPIAGVTALQGLRDEAELRRGERVLIVGAEGGVGTFAVQIAASMGGEVTAVCSPESARAVRALGAQHIIDYTIDDFTEQGPEYDVIFQIAGSASVVACRRALTPNGRLILCSSDGGQRLLGPMARIAGALIMGPFIGQKVKAYVAKAQTSSLDALTELIDTGAVAPVIDQVYPLSEAAAALRRFGYGHGPGKIVLTI